MGGGCIKRGIERRACRGEASQVDGVSTIHQWLLREGDQLCFLVRFGLIQA